MVKPANVRITVVEKHSDGIIVKFEDGRCVFYPASLLYQSIPQAQEQDEARSDW
jgi:hypothetical protein